MLVSIANTAKEITRKGEVVWSYKLARENKELGTAVRLADGNTLVVERGVKPRVLEVTKEGKIAVNVPLKPETDNAHMQTRMARKLPNGNYSREWPDARQLDSRQQDCRVRCQHAKAIRGHS